MRSHVTPRPTRAPPLLPSHSASSSSFSAADAAADDETAALAGLGYGLRENPRKSFRLVDPEFSASFAAANGGGGGGVSSVVQDRESETESSLPPPLRRRSKRTRRPPEVAVTADAEPLSSISDVSPEEDVARCLMLLSRDAWARLRAGEEADDQQSDGWDETAEDEDYNDDGEDGDEGIGFAARSRRRGRRSRYQCGTCKKFFRSYQALGGHRASHKKVAGSGCVPAAGGIQIGGEDSSEANADRNSSLHRCPFCPRVFGSAQALGGHKRSHLASSSSPVAAAAAAHSPPLPPPPLSANDSSTNLGGEAFIDLNQPAPLEEEVELSALSDATELQSK
ncbi:zinc finger protein ZAT1-like [Cocos nucifera]|nr:zinc finger protein ZAT1-like [Cocos nucifera]